MYWLAFWGLIFRDLPDVANALLHMDHCTTTTTTTPIKQTEIASPFMRLLCSWFLELKDGTHTHTHADAPFVTVIKGTA